MKYEYSPNSHLQIKVSASYGPIGFWPSQFQSVCINALEKGMNQFSSIYGLNNKGRLESLDSVAANLGKWKSGHQAYHCVKFTEKFQLNTQLKRWMDKEIHSL